MAELSLGEQLSTLRSSDTYRAVEELARAEAEARKAASAFEQRTTRWVKDVGILRGRIDARDQITREVVEARLVLEELKEPAALAAREAVFGTSHLAIERQVAQSETDFPGEADRRSGDG